MVHADAKVTWLLHLLSVSFRYPEAAYLKVRVFGIPVYSTEKKEQDKTEQDKNEQDKSEQNGQELDRVKADEAKQKDKTEEKTEEKAVEKQEEKQEELEKLLEEKIKEDEEEPTLIRFLKKLLEKLIKIKYTILQICDKIKHIVKNVRYYVAIMKSNCFQRAFSLCKEEVFSLIKSIMPRKLKGNFLIGTGLLQGILTANSISQHAVYQRRGIFLQLFAKLHRFIHCRRFRNLIHQIKLVKTQMQNIPHHGMQGFQLAGQQLFQVKVQQKSVLQHAVGQPGRQSSLPTV